MKKILLIVVIVLLGSAAAWQIHQVSRKKADLDQMARLQEGTLKPAATGPTAADIVPSDCSFFSTNLLLKEQLDKVRGSAALKRILDLPLVQLQLATIGAFPQVQQARQLFQTSPLARDSLEVAKDALSDEVFVCGDKSWVEVSKAILAFVHDSQLLDLKAALGEARRAVAGTPVDIDPAEKVAEKKLGMIRSILKHRDGLFAPGTIIGFKLSGSEEKLEGVLEEVSGRINDSLALPATVRTMEVHGNKYYSVTITDDVVPPGTIEKIRARLVEKGCTADEASEFTEWMKSGTVVVAAGYHKPYFIVSIGRDTAFLERLGQGDPLLGSPPFEPVERFKDRRVASIGYVSREMSAVGRFDPDQLKEMARGVIGELPEDKIPDGFKKDLEEKLAKISQDIEATLPEPSEIVSVSILNRGVESFSFSKSPQPGVDYSRPLTIMENTGGSPMFAAAAGSTGSAAEYETFRTWAGALYGTVRTYLVPELGEEKREKYEQLRAAVVPFLRAVDDATRNSLLPAIDAGQSLVVVDTGLRVDRIWKDRVLDTPLPLPAPSVAVELKDPVKFKEAVKAYVAAAENFVNETGRLKGAATAGQGGEFKAPAPEVEPIKDGKVYLYTPVRWLDAEVRPGVAVTDDLAVFSLSPSRAEAMCGKEGMPENDVVPMDLPSGCVLQFRTAPLLECVSEWADYIVKRKVGGEGGEESQAAAIMRQHMNALLQSIGAFKGLASRTYLDGDYVVTHSWAEFRDD